ncbi:MAG: Ig-like domain-containing protein [Thermodesulfobacteriota bacterium]
MDYFEDFNSSGMPAGPVSTYWYYKSDIYPAQDTWESFVPGDGYAHVILDADTENDTDPTLPFQIIGFGLVGPGHRLETRMKGALVSGVTGFIFTYQEDATFDEIDIELVTDDTEAFPDHAIDPPDGWNDARLNTWGNADPFTFVPCTTHEQPITGAEGEKVSHRDGLFHTYTIDWFGDHVIFYIDGAFQLRIDTTIPDSDSEVILGFRQTVWAGRLNWTGTRTLFIDWLNIQPIDGNTPVADADAYDTMQDQPLSVPAPGILANDTGSGLSVKQASGTGHGLLVLNADGSFNYTPDPGFSGKDNFTYFSDDGSENGESNAAVVTIQVNQKDDGGGTGDDDDDSTEPEDDDGGTTVSDGGSGGCFINTIR